MFFKGSRYENVDTAEIELDGRAVSYKLTRFIGDAVARAGHEVGAEERLDHISHRYFKDAERFWRICDANLAEWPPDLVADVGRVIGIPSSKES
ncbi:MAG: hypothetical protein AAF628_19390 [Planctomycetota bacterium]